MSSGTEHAHVVAAKLGVATLWLYLVDEDEGNDPYFDHGVLEAPTAEEARKQLADYLFAEFGSRRPLRLLLNRLVPGPGVWGFAPNQKMKPFEEYNAKLQHAQP